MEIYKDIEGYEGRYSISNYGNVLSFIDQFKRVRDVPFLMRPAKRGHPPHNYYSVVNLYKDSKSKPHSVHRLVARAFLPNPDNLPIVNHKDENTFNNCENNLEWCTNQYNQEYSLAKDYEFLNPEGSLVKIRNIRKFARDNNLNHAHMYQVHLGRLKSHKKWTKNV